MHWLIGRKNGVGLLSFCAFTLGSKVDMMVGVLCMFCFSLHLSQSKNNVLILSTLLTLFEVHVATCLCSLIFIHMYNGSGEPDKKGPHLFLVGPGQNAPGISANPSLTPDVHDTRLEMRFHNKQTSISAQFLSAPAPQS